MKINPMLIFVFLSGLLLSSCNRDRDKDYSLSINPHSTIDEKLIVDIVCYGNTISYQTLLDKYADNFRYEEMLAYSLIMANRYDYSKAYFDVFDILTSIPNHNASICADTECLEEGYFCLDKRTKDLAIEYFRQAVFKGDLFASNKLMNTYNKNKKYPIDELFNDDKLIQKAIDNINSKR